MDKAPVDGMLRPAFSLMYLSDEKDYSLEGCDGRDKGGLLSTMAKLSRLEWAQIQSAHRHGLGHETIDRGSIRAKTPGGVGGDVRFLAFRFSGMKPMVGFRRGAVFYIVWLDTKFRLYDHG